MTCGEAKRSSFEEAFNPHSVFDADEAAVRPDKRSGSKIELRSGCFFVAWRDFCAAASARCDASAAADCAARALNLKTGIG